MSCPSIVRYGSSADILAQERSALASRVLFRDHIFRFGTWNDCPTRGAQKVISIGQTSQGPGEACKVSTADASTTYNIRKSGRHYADNTGVNPHEQQSPGLAQIVPAGEK